MIDYGRSYSIRVFNKEKKNLYNLELNCDAMLENAIEILVAKQKAIIKISDDKFYIVDKDAELGLIIHYYSYYYDYKEVVKL